MFLIRAAFWLTLVVMLLPADPPTKQDNVSVNPIQAIGAARDTVADVSSFCDRNPDACVTGGAVMDLLVRKARYGIRKATEYFDSARHEQPTDDGTLTNEDAIPPWHPPKRPSPA
jgi:hypothetical protein